MTSHAGRGRFVQIFAKLIKNLAHNYLWKLSLRVRSIRRACSPFQCRPATVGTHQQARQCSAALLVGGDSTSGGAERCGLAAAVRTSGEASGKEHCQGRDGAPSGGSTVLDVAKGMGSSVVLRVRFVRGRARYRTWGTSEFSLAPAGTKIPGQIKPAPRDFYRDN
jgi:hypothetical protein